MAIQSIAMVTIANYVHKGGAGKSTLSFVLACIAAREGRQVLLVGLDPQGDAVRWAGKGDRPLQRDDPFESSKGFTVIYSPGRMPSVPAHIDLVIVDCPPTPDQAVPFVKPDLWLVPLDGRAALIDTMQVLPAIRAQGGAIIFVLNKADAGGTRVEAALREAAGKVPNSLLWPEAIPMSGTIARVGEYALPPWDVPFGKESEGSLVLERFCAALLTAAAQAKKGTQAKTLAKPAKTQAPTTPTKGTSKPRGSR